MFIPFTQICRVFINFQMKGFSFSFLISSFIALGSKCCLYSFYFMELTDLFFVPWSVISFSEHSWFFKMFLEKMYSLLRCSVWYIPTPPAPPTKDLAYWLCNLELLPPLLFFVHLASLILSGIFKFPNINVFLFILASHAVCFKYIIAVLAST